MKKASPRASASISESWVVEGATGRLARGRRPTFLRLNDDRVIVGVDIRPGETTVALADANGKFTSREVITTPSDPKAAVDELLRSIQRVRSSRRGKSSKASASVSPAASTRVPAAWSSPPISSGAISICARRSGRPRR